MKLDGDTNSKENKNHVENVESTILESRVLSEGSDFTMLEDNHKAAHRCVLFNFEEVQPYLKKHKSELIRQDRRL
ncbi:hypothetical protein GIB67_006976 [Kingdonia uniflora]|uniref:Uncharacterized protein n=1 Tax=Kingdonia uniflora TaxID=39325 RepID=A0A7J7NZE3_9MAGN|nr:hypothetical protein GIB67_006976 [Kingdonia uniflora]